MTPPMANLHHRIIDRFLEAAKGPTNLTDVRPSPALSEAAFAVLIEVGKKHGLKIEGKPGDFKIEGPAEAKTKDLQRLFDTVWYAAGDEVRRQRLEGHGISVIHKPKLDWSRYTKRDQSGQYMHTVWTRLCKCGHPVGVHSAEKGSDGSQPCIAGDFGVPCECMKFRATNSFMPEEEFEKTFKSASFSLVRPIGVDCGKVGQMPSDAALRIATRYTKTASSLVLKPDTFKVQITLTQVYKKYDHFVVIGNMHLGESMGVSFPAIPFNFKVDKAVLTANEPYPNITLDKVPMFEDYIEACLIEDWDQIEKLLLAAG